MSPLPWGGSAPLTALRSKGSLGARLSKAHSRKSLPLEPSATVLLSHEQDTS